MRNFNPQITVEVMIIGGGPVGLLLANLLGSQGIQTIVVEKRRSFQSDRPLAIGITPPSLEILKAVGLDLVFSREGVPVRHAEVLESRRSLGRLDFNEIDSDYRFFLSIPQTRTVELLERNLSKYPAVRVSKATEFLGLKQEEHGVIAHLCDSENRIEFEARARLLAGCDGQRSQVRKAAKIDFRERIYPQRFVMADFKDHSGLGSEARLFFAPEASVESFPLPDGLRRWIILANDRGEESPTEYLVRRVKALTGFDLGIEPASFVSTFGARRMVVNRYYSGRVVLAGDAAHTMSSIGGQGMNTGFADAEMLARFAPILLQNPARVEECFAGYDAVRRRAYEVAARRAEQGMWLGTLRGRFASGFRRHLIKDVLFSAPLRRRLAPHFAMLTIPNRTLKHTPAQHLAVT